MGDIFHIHNYACTLDMKIYERIERHLEFTLIGHLSTA